MCVRDLRESDQCALFSKEHVDATKLMECAKRIAKRDAKTLGEFLQERMSN